MLLRKRLGVWALASVAAVAACDGPTDAGLASRDLQEIEADLVYYDMTSYLSSGGVREGRVRADTAYMYRDSSRVDLTGMHIVFYDEQGRDKATVTALGGEMDTRSDRMVARGDVVLIVHSDGRKIETPELHYDPDLDRIWSDSATVQTLADGRVTRGSTFRSDLEFNNVEITDPRGDVGEIIF